eukprot:TRINITY_DN8278_c0_g1_i1.p1 TRINITY_DN8278_c0_g1~~TRINITY_DN8278_c0_g1_i1.p1  ORF type:complete len:867 (-),score=72.67 TRINITY_DN8278_c0_g1_i1:62-2662(-)
MDDIKINRQKRTSLSVDFGKRASVSNIIRLANWNLLELSNEESHKDPPSPNSSDPPTPRKRNTIEEEKEILNASAHSTREVMQVRRRASSEGWIQAFTLSSSPSPGRVLRRTNSDGLFQSFEGLVLTSGESYESRSQQSESGSASPRSFTDEIDEIQFEPVFRPRAITKRESVLSLQNKLVTKSEDGRKSVLAASIENLIFKLTTREVPDFDLLHEFLLTYPYYLDSFKLLEYLKERFEYNPPQGADDALKKDYDEHRPVIRSRVYTVIKTWLKNYSFYFKKDKILLRKVRHFIDIEIGSAKKIWADQLNALLVFLQLVNSNTNKKKKKKNSARRRNRSALTKGSTPRDNQPGSIEIVTTQAKTLVAKRSKDDLEIGAKPRSDTVFSLSSTNSDDSADTEPDLSSKFGDFIDMDGPKSNPAMAQPPAFLNSFKLAAPKSSAALLAGRDRSESSASESGSAVSSGAATAGRVSPPKVKPLVLKGLPKNGSPSPPSSPVKGAVKSSREEVKKPLSGGKTGATESPRTDRDRSKSGLRSPLTSPKAPEGEAFRRTHNRVRSTGNAKIHTIVSPKDSPNNSLDVVEEEERQKELEKAKMKAKATKYKNELFNANVVKKPRNDFSPLLLSLDPHELAKQLTLVEHKKYSLIAPTELMMTNWKKKDRKTVSKRVCILIEWFNKMTAWVASEIVSAPILKQRVAVITFFIRVCEACKELNNFNTLMEILSGLDMTAVVRLKTTWESIPKKDMQSLEELREIVSRNDNYSRYRHEVDAINTPTPYLPYIGLVLQDLVALEELPTIDRDGLVNFRKFKRVSKILQRVHDLKILNFKLEPVVPLQKYLKKGVQILGDMDLLRFSRVCEPSQQAMLF